jgi:hypothetical protein
MKKSAIMMMGIDIDISESEDRVAKVINSENEQIEEESMGGTRAEKHR